MNIMFIKSYMSILLFILTSSNVYNVNKIVRRNLLNIRQLTCINAHKETVYIVKSSSIIQSMRAKSVRRLLVYLFFIHGHRLSSDGLGNTCHRKASNSDHLYLNNNSEQ